MYDNVLRELEYISQAVGNSIDYTQGGGGNTSVKLDDSLMAVKASGFKLKQINSTEGYVVLNYQKVRDFFAKVDLNLDLDYEQECTAFIRDNVIEMEGLKKLRPSVEAGFHSILKQYVIHTHSVYANILCCSKNGAELVAKVFNGKNYTTAWIPYHNPGFSLTLKINEVIKKTQQNGGKFPEVIFMENHGLIVTADDSKKCTELHQEVNDTIKEFLNLQEPFPSIELQKTDETKVLSKTKYLKEFFKHNPVNPDFFDQTVLYPDQLVYLNGSVTINNLDQKLNINTNTGEIIYQTSFSEAETIEETLLAYLYVLNGIKQSGLPLKTMSEKEINFIKNWESEAYRKSLAKDFGSSS